MYIGDEIIPGSVGIVINHSEDPGSLLNNQYFNGKYPGPRVF